MKWHNEIRKLSDLIPYKHNPRKITEKGKADLKKSIERYGLAEPIVINTDNTIIGGHARYYVLQETGGVEADCYVPDRQLTEKESQELNIRLNKNIAGEFDWDILANEFEIEDLKEWGFDEKELNLGLPQEVVEDEAPEVAQGEPDSKLGEVYQLGRHRLMCGDATKKEDVEKLMDGVKADMVFTDPPYGYNTGGYAGRSKKFDVIEGNQGDVKRFYDAIPTDIPERYIWGGFPNFVDLQEMPRDVIVWKKNNFGMGRGYRGQYELCFYYGAFSGSDSDVWEQDKDTDYKHPTQKPVALAARAIKNSNPKTILDIYGGSGSTLIAAEQTGRTCYMMELDPKYCDVIRKRYNNFVNKDNSDEQREPKAI